MRGAATSYGPLYFRQIGMSMIKNTRENLPPDLISKSEERTFRAIFGASWLVVAKIWKLLEEHYPNRHKRPCHVLWALIFVKQYGNEQSHCMMVGGGVTLKTFRKWVWKILDEMSEVSSIKVRQSCIWIWILFINFQLTLFMYLPILDWLGEQEEGWPREWLPCVSWLYRL